MDGWLVRSIDGRIVQYSTRVLLLCNAWVLELASGVGVVILDGGRQRSTPLTCEAIAPAQAAIVKRELKLSCIEVAPDAERFLEMYRLYKLFRRSQY